MDGRVGSGDDEGVLLIWLWEAIIRQMELWYAVRFTLDYSPSNRHVLESQCTRRQITLYRFASLLTQSRRSSSRIPVDL